MAENQISHFFMYSVLSAIPRMIVKTLVQKVILVFSLDILLIPVLTDSKPELQSMTSGHISSGLDLTYAPSTITTQQPSEGKLDLLFKAMYDDYIGGQPLATARTVLPAPEPQTNENCQYKWKAVRFVERRNRTLVEANRTMLIFSRAPLFLWAEAIATACFTQNRSIIHHRFNKTPYELINGRKLDISFLHVFGALCYPKNDREDIGKLGAKGDIGFFIGYSADSCAYRVFNRQIKKIIETMHVSFDELSAMAFE
nr:retrovirus-related Pol polyprotein from transposon TNT 1-94 [Tanacetum cinerariifolium]